MSEHFPYDLVMFDLDGTLIETSPEICDAVNDTLAEIGRPLVTQQQVDDWIGHGTKELLIQALAHLDGVSADSVRTSDTLPGYLKVFDGHYQRRCGTRSHLYPHVREALHALRLRGIKLAVVTNKEGRYTQAVLDSHQMSPLFDRVISGDTLSMKKPNPAAIDDCLQRFGVARNRALFVGDSSIDIATARNGEVAVWAMPYGYNMGQAIEAANPDRIVADFSVFL
jgi:phosphoglycolate phosphatase